MNPASVYHLRKCEVEYELKIRGVSVGGSAGELRKRFAQCLSTGVDIDESVVNSLDPEYEVEECETTYGDLSSKITEYDGNFKDNEFQRLYTRLLYLSHRVDRIPITASMDDDLDQRKSELVDKVKDQLACFVAKGASATSFKTQETDSQSKKGNVSHTSDPKPTVANPATQLLVSDLLNFSNVPKDNESPPQSQQKCNNVQPNNLFQEYPNPAYTRLPASKFIPVYKWGIKFDNSSGQSVGAFLERVEELRRARGVTPTELFEAAVDLFSGSALIWYCSTISRIKSWDGLCKEMKIVFQAPDYDYRLQQELFYRMQGENEPIDMFIAAMEGLYIRLASNVPEETRMKQIMHNLHPQLQDRLALFEIKTVEELRLLGRKAEAGRLRSNHRPSTQQMSTLEPDLAYFDPNRRKQFQSPKIASAYLQSSASLSTKCWNCGLMGHRYTQCSKDRKRFCFGCGHPNVFKANCPKCSSKNGLGREPTPRT